MSGKCDMRVKNSNYVYMYVSYHFGTAICLGFRNYTSFTDIQKACMIDMEKYISKCFVLGPF